MNHDPIMRAVESTTPTDKQMTDADAIPHDPQSPEPKPMLSNKTYDHFKRLVTILLPAIGTLYFALAPLWDLPSPEKVVGTVTAISLFLGTILNVSSKQYQESDYKYDGSIDIQDLDEARKNFLLNLKGDPYDLESQKHVTFKVNKL